MMKVEGWGRVSLPRPLEKEEGGRDRRLYPRDEGKALFQTVFGSLSRTVFGGPNADPLPHRGRIPPQGDPPLNSGKFLLPLTTCYAAFGRLM